MAATFTHPLSSGPSRTGQSERGASSHGPGHELGCATARGCPGGGGKSALLKRFREKKCLDHCRRKCKLVPTCVMEPPCLLEEMSGGGSGMVSGLTAANRPPSCERPTIAGWAPCWNAGMKSRFIIFTFLFLSQLPPRNPEARSENGENLSIPIKTFL